MFSYVDGRCAVYLILVLCSHGDGGVVCRAAGCEGVVGWRVGDSAVTFTNCGEGKETVAWAGAQVHCQCCYQGKCGLCLQVFWLPFEGRI